MPHHHDHSHGHAHSGKTDKWTKISTASALPQFISTLFWLARMFDIATGEDENTVIGISWYAFAFGIIVASLTAAGTTYSHYNLNLNNQDIKSNNKKDDELSDQHDEEAQSIKKYEDIDFDEIQQDPRRLSLIQTLALILDYVGHVGEDAGPIGFVFDLMTKNLDIPRWGVGIFYAVAAVYGSLTAVADVRSCKKSMQDVNEIRAKTKDDTEYWCGFFPRKRKENGEEHIHSHKSWRNCWYTP